MLYAIVAVLAVASQPDPTQNTRIFQIEDKETEQPLPAGASVTVNGGQPVPTGPDGRTPPITLPNGPVTIHVSPPQPASGLSGYQGRDFPNFDPNVVHLPLRSSDLLPDRSGRTRVASMPGNCCPCVCCACWPCCTICCPPPPSCWCRADAATPKQAVANGSATLVLSVPDSAVVFINGKRTAKTGTRRNFVSHGMEDGLAYRYAIRVEVIRDGKSVEDVREIILRAGDSKDLAFDLSSKNAVQIAAAR